jgi:hypothetical protein
MVPPKLLVSLAGAFSLTLTLASPTPGEMHPAFRPSAPGDPSWYCTVRHRVVLDYFTLEGRNWNISEYGLRTVLASRGGAISNWFYEGEVKDGVQEFIAHVSASFVFLFFFCGTWWLFSLEGGSSSCFVLPHFFSFAL